MPHTCNYIFNPWDFDGHFVKRPHFDTLHKCNTNLASLKITLIKTNGKSGQTRLIDTYSTHIHTLYGIRNIIYK